jgi:hypothetical protein
MRTAEVHMYVAAGDVSDPIISSSSSSAARDADTHETYLYAIFCRRSRNSAPGFTSWRGLHFYSSQLLQSEPLLAKQQNYFVS